MVRLFLTFNRWSMLLLAVGNAVAQERPDLTIFDEDDSVGAGYYDASVGSAIRPSTLKLDGPGDKLIIVTNQAYTGHVSGLLQWQSDPQGGWTVFVARPGFSVVNASGYSNLAFWVNSPQPIQSRHLPYIGLESSPPDVQTRPLKLGDYLVAGVDSDASTWQLISVPLSDFVPKTGFSLAKVKDVVFSQGPVADDIPHTLWVDNLRLVTGAGNITPSTPPPTPANVVTRTGDQSVVLHWDWLGTNELTGYNVYRAASSNAALTRLTATPIPIRSYADLSVTNEVPCFYSVRAVNSAHLESQPSSLVSATPHAFASDEQFLEYLQQTAFDYFWFEANPDNGLIRDRSDPASAASVAAVGFGLSAIGIGVDHGWIPRGQALDRVRKTLRTFWEMPQGTNLTGTIGCKGWFYHFLEMNTATRFGTSELSSIDTALFLAGMLDAKQFFDRSDSGETEVRRLADSIFKRVNWSWMSQGGSWLSYGWHPESGFLSSRWLGYNEAMVLYLLGLGADTNPLPSVHWQSWTSTYSWQTNYGLAFVTFPPLFGHQYSQCWVDFRHSADAYMRVKGLTYFENSRRATLSQRAYCINNPGHFVGYSTNVWGLTACDGPGVSGFEAYAARGAPPPLDDDGTIAPTAVGGSLPFTPEYSLPTLRSFYDRFRTHLWTGYGFRDAFNLQANWWGPHVVGIDQGPILLMAENFRSGRVWKRFMQNPEIQRGLLAAGFTSGAFQPLSLQRTPATSGSCIPSIDADSSKP